MFAKATPAAIAAAAISVCPVLNSEAGEIIYGVSANQTLLTWDSSSPDAILSGMAIQGLAANERVHGIDFRPATGQLYALGSYSNLYTIDASTGQASLVGSFAGAETSLNGSSFGFDFNPVIDRIRVVSEVDQNLVLNPNDGSATRVTDLFYGAGDNSIGTNPNVVASAYTNSIAGASSTQLYGVDSALDVLVTQANSAGTLATVGSLGADVNDTLTFDISGVTGAGYMTVQAVDKTRSTFWTIDLMTGEASMIGEIGGGSLITAMTIVPTPGGVAAFGLALLPAGRRRRR